MYRQAIHSGTSSLPNMQQKPQKACIYASDIRRPHRREGSGNTASYSKRVRDSLFVAWVLLIAVRFNKRRDDFPDLRSYNDYLEEVEDISAYPSLQPPNLK